MKLLSLLVTVGMTLSSVTYAANLDGHIMNCSVDLSKTFGGIQNTTFQFIRGANASDLVLSFTQGSEDNGTRVLQYFLSGTTVALTLDAGHVDKDTPVYDISNPKSIKRPFQSCVFPGQGGGDSHATCADVVENCVLN